MGGMPADKSLLSKIEQGSKSFKPKRVLRNPRRVRGSRTKRPPSGKSIAVGFFISSDKVPKRTLRPACRRIDDKHAMFCK